MPVTPGPGQLPAIPAGVGIGAIDFVGGGDVQLVNVVNLVSPSTQTAPLTGSALDMVTLTGDTFAIQSIGVFEEGNTWTAKVQESTTGVGAWTDVTGGAFAAVTEGAQTEILRFTRTKRYLRVTSTIVGVTPDLTCSVVAGNVVPD